MGNKYLSKADFLAGITLTPVDFEVPGVGLVRVRGLTTLELSELQRTYGGDPIAMMLAGVKRCLVEPALDTSELDQLGQGKPGVIQAIGDCIMELSGIRDTQAGQDALEKKAGSGS